MVNIKKFVREIPNWPKAGVNFKDITPLLQNKKAFQETINQTARPFEKNPPDLVVGIDARGFLLAAPLAYRLHAGLAIVRKKGKLPHKTLSAKYALEYATDCLEMHADAIKKGQKVVIADDVLATGGTMAATIELVEKLGGKIIGLVFLITLDFLNGRKKLKKYKIKSLISYK